MQVVWDHRKPSEEDRGGGYVNGCVVTGGPGGAVLLDNALRGYVECTLTLCAEGQGSWVSSLKLMTLIG